MKEIKAPYRFDHVGSLLRPDNLLEARKDWKSGKITAEELRLQEDKAINRCVKFQENVGLSAITDGEYRRESFHVDFLHQIENVTSNWDFDEVVKVGEQNQSQQKKTMPFIPRITGKISRPGGGFEVQNFKYTSSLTEKSVKVTMPSPTMTHFRGGREAIDSGAYPTVEEFFSDLALLYQDEIFDLAKAGCRYIQFDDTNLAYLCDEKMRENVRKLGENPDMLPELYAALINDAIARRPSDVTVCVHLCRGNAKSRWFASGGYEPVADKMFNLLQVDGYFLEYDDDRSGDFEPLRFVPKGEKRIVLGLVTTKTGQLENKDQLKRRIEEATKFVDIDQLCLSPQCGFSSNAIGNLITENDQKQKLQLVIETAQEIWGN
ncbi:MAG: 5-methyltetrahydropteroyltriglutamate--homocysteine S-methyltransferase [Pseudomonadota bacterium]|nr:5-methyltetrahydropteroyltriglutamate--homocysteine S-methyltransferase [Pseudomonadota bacterium]